MTDPKQYAINRLHIRRGIKKERPFSFSWPKATPHKVVYAGVFSFEQNNNGFEVALLNPLTLKGVGMWVPCKCFKKHYNK